MKYLKVEVTRQSSTDLFVEVPDDFDPALMLRDKYRKQLGRIAMETTDRLDWDDYEWENTVEAHGVKVVSEKEASDYMIGTLSVISQDDPPLRG